MSETGRNELCPCGSGKKYKKCCITKSSLQKKHTISVISNPETSKPLPAGLFGKKTEEKKSETST